MDDNSSAASADQALQGTCEKDETASHAEKNRSSRKSSPFLRHFSPRHDSSSPHDRNGCAKQKADVGNSKKSGKFWGFLSKKKSSPTKECQEMTDDKQEASVSCLCSGIKRTQGRLNETEKASIDIQSDEVGHAESAELCEYFASAGNAVNTGDTSSAGRGELLVSVAPAQRRLLSEVQSGLDETDDVEFMRLHVRNLEQLGTNRSTYPHLSYTSGSSVTSLTSIHSDHTWIGNLGAVASPTGGLPGHLVVASAPVYPALDEGLIFERRNAQTGAVQDLTSDDLRSRSRQIPCTVHTQVDYVHCLVPDLLKITNCSYYWGVMDRYEAERLLENRTEGTFLLRDSAQEEFLFSVSFRRYSRSLHARVEQWDHKFSFDSHDASVYASPSVCGLIEHYKDPACCMFFEPMLTIPLARTSPFSLQHLCRSTICSNTTYDGISCLPLPKTLVQYLQYYHYKQKVRVRRFESHR